MSADSGPGQREVAHRLFAAEFDDADLSYSESDEERAPNYVVTPTGARVNRLFAVGVLTAVERVNEDVLRARVADPTGAFVTYAGQYQPDALAFLDRTQPPEFVALTGKARTFQPDDSDRVFTSVRPESVNRVDAETRDRWVVSAAEATLARVSLFAEALALDVRGDDLRATLSDRGAPEALAAGIPLAIDHYGTTPAYLDAVRQLALDALGVVTGTVEEVEPLSLAPGEGGGGEVGPLPDPSALSTVAAAALGGGATVTASETVETTGDSASATSDDSASATTETESAETAATETVEPTASTETAEPTTTEEPADASEPSESVESTTAATETTGSAEVTETESTEPTAETSTTVADDAPAEADEAGESGADPDDTDDLGEDDTDDLGEDDTDDLGEDDTDDLGEDDTDDLGDFDDGSGADELGDFDDDSGTGSDGDEPADADVAPGERYELDEEEREELEAEFGTDFETGTEVDDAGEADIDVPSADELAETAEADETDAGASSDPEPDAEATADPSGDDVATDDEPGASDEPDTGDAGDADADVDLSDAVVDAMADLDDGDGAAHDEVVSQVTAAHGVDADAVEDAIQDALMSGKCYEPADGRLKAI